MFGVRINGQNCWIEFADVAGAMSALRKDNTESGGHHLRISQSKTPIRSNGYAKGRAAQTIAAAAAAVGGAVKSTVHAPSATMSFSKGVAQQQGVGGRGMYAPQISFPAGQLSPEEIIASINQNIAFAVEFEKKQAAANAAAAAAGAETREVPPPPPGGAGAAVVRVSGLPAGSAANAFLELFEGVPGVGTIDPDNVLVPLDANGVGFGRAYVEFSGAEAAAAALRTSRPGVELAASSRAEATAAFT